VRYQIIDAGKARIPVRRLCKLIQVSSSGYYAWRKRPPSPRQHEDVRLLTHIRAVFSSSYRSYGSPRMHREIVALGFDVGRYRVARLMREDGLKAKRTRAFKKTTNSNHRLPIAPNVLEQDFSADGPDQKWSADISYIKTAEGWLYLAVILDLFSRRAVGWAMSDRMRCDLPMLALERAIALRQPPPGLIHHSDRGSQYCATDYQNRIKSRGIVPSMSGKGNCYDNAPVESFFKTIKAELVWRTRFDSRHQAETTLGNYINGFYNSKRRHSALGFNSPIQFEQLNGDI